MKPTLFILAAGTGSRYGGLKQIEKLGPNGETLIDYSIYDAIKTGFGKIVIVIRKSFEKEFYKEVAAKYKDIIPVELIYQELNTLPADIKTNPEREAPWGTCHALVVARQTINEPFGVINSDDFYGRESFQLLAGQLANMGESKYEYRSISYMVGNTLTDTGTVARAVCEVDENNYLTKIVEQTEVQRVNGVPSYQNKEGEWINLTDTTRVSMNMWAFTPDIFKLAENHLISFLKDHKDDLETEFPIPTLINEIISAKEAKVKLMSTPAKWFGITYPTDKPEVMHRLRELIEDELYPHKLF